MALFNERCPSSGFIWIALYVDGNTVRVVGLKIIQELALSKLILVELYQRL